jgi:hypothetical protein
VDVAPGVGHQADVARGLVRREGPQRVGQVDALDGQLAQRLHHREDVVEGIAHAVRPVFEVDVHRDARLVGGEDRLLHALAVLLGCLAELFAAVLFRTFGQQVHHATPTA